MLLCTSPWPTYPRGILAFSLIKKSILWFFPTAGIAEDVIQAFDEVEPTLIVTAQAPLNGHIVRFTNVSTYDMRANKQTGKMDTMQVTAENRLTSIDRDVVFNDSLTYVISIGLDGKLRWWKSLFYGYSQMHAFKMVDLPPAEFYVYSHSNPNVIETTHRRVDRMNASGETVETLEIPIGLALASSRKDFRRGLTLYDSTTGDVIRMTKDMTLNTVKRLGGKISEINEIGGYSNENEPYWKVRFRNGRAFLYDRDFQRSIRLDSALFHSSQHLVHSGPLTRLIISQHPDGRVAYSQIVGKPGYVEHYGWFGLLFLPGIAGLLLLALFIHKLPPLFTLPKADLLLDRLGRMTRISDKAARLLILEAKMQREHYRAILGRENLAPLLRQIELFRSRNGRENRRMETFEFDFLAEGSEGMIMRRLQIQFLPLRDQVLWQRTYLAVEINDLTRELSKASVAGVHRNIFHISHSTKNLLDVSLGDLDRIESKLNRGSPPEAETKAVLDQLEDRLRFIIEMNARAISESNLTDLQLLARDEPISGATLYSEITGLLLDRYSTRVSIVRSDLTGIVVSVNRQLYWEAVNQIVENGIIASPERTEVVVAGEIRIVDRERRLRVTVRDRGKGIALKDRLRIFQPDFTTREKQGGTGLGLPRALAIITAHDGEIAFESELGEGSIFRIDIPEHAAIEA